MSLLEIKGLEVRYGGIRAVKGIDLTVDEGELVCLIGANGAGKTSALKSICGLLPAAQGTVTYAGKSITGAPSFRLVREGLEAQINAGQKRGRLEQVPVTELSIRCPGCSLALETV